MPDNPIILDIQGNDGFELEFEDSEDLDFETQPYSKGDPGKSAYQVAVDNGFSGTEEEWLASLVGPEGPPGTTDWDGITNKPYLPWEQGVDANNQPVPGAIKSKDFTAEGITGTNTASGISSLAFGANNNVTSNYSVGIGYNNTVAGVGGSTLFGHSNQATSGSWGFAAGVGNTISHNNVTALGWYNTASNYNAVALGRDNIASGNSSSAIGYGNTASATAAHAEGRATVASGNYSHSGGLRTVANSKSQTVFGEYNAVDSGFTAANARGTYVEIVGNGADAQNLSNARTLDWDGNEVLAGKLTVGADPTANMDVATKQYVDNAVLNAAVNANECLTFWHASDVI